MTRTTAAQRQMLRPAVIAVVMAVASSRRSAHRRRLQRAVYIGAVPTQEAKKSRAWQHAAADELVDGRGLIVLPHRHCRHQPV